MNNRTKGLLLLACLVFLVGVAGSIRMLVAEPDTELVNIIQNGRVVYRLNLADTEDRMIDINQVDGKNTVQIEDGRIRILHADCPDQICVKMGWLEKLSLPIVCLPNRLVIEYASGEMEADATVR